MKTFYELGCNGEPYSYDSSLCTENIDEFYELLKEFKTLKTTNKEQKTAFYQNAKVDKSKNRHRSTKEKATLWVLPDYEYDLKLEKKDFLEVLEPYQKGNVHIPSGEYVLRNYTESKLKLGRTKEFGVLKDTWHSNNIRTYNVIKDVVSNKKSWIIDKEWGIEGGDEIDISLFERLFTLDDKKVIVQIVSDIDIYKYRLLLRILFTIKQFKLADFGTKKNIPKLCGYYTSTDILHICNITIRLMTDLDEIILALKYGLRIDLKSKIDEKINQRKT